MNKKGAIELSVTAIVILILAVVMLGLGLGFVRGMFGKVSASFEQQIGAEPEAAEAIGDEPITLSRENIITYPGENIVLKVNTLNPTVDNWVNAKPELSCADTVNFGSATSTSIAKSVNVGASASYNLLIGISKTAKKMIYICVVNMTKDGPPSSSTPPVTPRIAAGVLKEITLTVK
ncbi:hypothetical protein HYU14_04975 [Candidatus Woesearchaeota archaeon]|nr:hypothetical protein [Candidatus Woesearchaeota archaeon]